MEKSLIAVLGTLDWTLNKLMNRYISQTDYTEELKQVDRDIYPSDVKNKVCVQIVGQLQWIATQSRPDPFFDVLVLATYCD